MSLDVHLQMKKNEGNSHEGSGIFVRENGQTKEISRAEWDEKFPGREPIVAITESDDGYVYNANITHNLGRMASEAGIYKYLWCPDEIGVTKAQQLIEPLTTGLSVLLNDRARFEQFNPSNGWGSYDTLVDFVEGYLDACKRFPQADVYISR